MSGSDASLLSSISGGSCPRPAMIIRHIMNTPIMMPANKPKENCSISTTFLYPPHRPQVK